MGLFYFVITFIILLVLAIIFNVDDRRPMSPEIKYRFRVKDNSIFRKLIRFKDKPFFPCNYFKIIPIYIYSFLALVSLAIFLIDILANKVISAFLEDKIICICCVIIYVIYFIYLFALIVWWEIADNEKMKFTKEEKIELKNLRKKRKK